MVEPKETYSWKKKKERFLSVRKDSVTMSIFEDQSPLVQLGIYKTNSLYRL
jgi:hypothetical protein